jgi:hypothetical protein
MLLLGVDPSFSWRVKPVSMSARFVEIPKFLFIVVLVYELEQPPRVSRMLSVAL